MSERDRALRDAETRAVAQTDMAVQNVRRLIEGADTALTAVSIMIGPAPDWNALSRDAPLWRAMHEISRALSAVPRLTAIDQDGMIRILGDQFAVTPVWVGDRDFFIHGRDQASPGSYIGIPVTGRVIRAPLLPFSRRLSRADGFFAGVLNANIQPQAFVDLFASMHGGPGEFFTLQRGDGVILARFPDLPGVIGSKVGDERQIPGIVQGNAAGVVRMASPVDGITGVAAFRRLSPYDLVVIAGTPVHQILAPWWRQTLRMAAVIGIGLVALTALLVLLLQRRRVELRVQERLRTSEENLRQAQSVARLGYYVYDVIVDRWESSPILDAIFGIDAAYSRSGAGWLDLVEPSMRPRMERYLGEILAGEHDFDQEYPIIRHDDGQQRWVFGLGEVERDGAGRPVRMVGTIQDITEQQQAQERMRSSEEKLRSLFDLAPLGIALSAMDGTILEANSAFLAISGHSLEQLRRLRHWDLVAAGPAGHEAEQMEMLRTQGRYGPCETQYLHGSGRRVPVVLNGVRVTDADGNLAIWSIVEDITEREAAHRALCQKAEELSRSNEELEQFAYVASHDLREPLRMVSSYVDLLGRRYADRLDDDAREFIAFAKDGATRMDRLVLDLLEYSRIGRITRPMVVVDLDMVFERVGRALQAKIAEGEAQVVMASSGLPDVLGDSEELWRLFQNLLGNAVKYRAPDRPPVVTVSAQRRGVFWEITVADNGIGIDPQYFERVFLIFQRLHKRGDYEGTGIGLAICKKIAERHGGRIWLDSTPGEGSAFHVSLPAVDYPGA